MTATNTAVYAGGAPPLHGPVGTRGRGPSAEQLAPTEPRRVRVYDGAGRRGAVGGGTGDDSDEHGSEGGAMTAVGGPGAGDEPSPAGGRAPLQLRVGGASREELHTDRKSTRLNSSHVSISYAVFCFKTHK